MDPWAAQDPEAWPCRVKWWVIFLALNMYLCMYSGIHHIHILLNCFVITYETSMLYNMYLSCVFIFSLLGSTWSKRGKGRSWASRGPGESKLKSLKYRNRIENPFNLLPCIFVYNPTHLPLIALSPTSLLSFSAGFTRTSRSKGGRGDSRPQGELLDPRTVHVSSSSYSLAEAVNYFKH